MVARAWKNQRRGTTGPEALCYRQRDEEPEQERKLDEQWVNEIKGRCCLSWKEYAGNEHEQKPPPLGFQESEIAIYDDSLITSLLWIKIYSWRLVYNSNDN